MYFMLLCPCIYFLLVTRLLFSIIRSIGGIHLYNHQLFLMWYTYSYTACYFGVLVYLLIYHSFMNIFILCGHSHISVENDIKAPNAFSYCTKLAISFKVRLVARHLPLFLFAGNLASSDQQTYLLCCPSVCHQGQVFRVSFQQPLTSTYRSICRFSNPQVSLILFSESSSILLLMLVFSLD